ncbi:MAG: sporulation protein YjcZ [Firmicutes bacterium]|mgnify:CR=1 FL=1|nr:sporulation protein YjcZ [Bacillota bacterium]
MVVIKVGYPVAGAGCSYGGGVQAAAFVLVLFILLVIILRAGIFY